MDRACSTHGAKREMYTTGFWWGGLKKSDYSEDLDIDWWIILKCILKIQDGDLGLYSLAKGRESGRFL
jgi:hypothetical protein